VRGHAPASIVRVLTIRALTIRALTIGVLTIGVLTIGVLTIRPDRLELAAVVAGQSIGSSLLHGPAGQSPGELAAGSGRSIGE